LIFTIKQKYINPPKMKNFKNPIYKAEI